MTPFRCELATRHTLHSSVATTPDVAERKAAELLANHGRATKPPNGNPE
jgi:hypothetical protein